MITAGIDGGLRTIKVLLFDTEQSQILSSSIADQGVEQEQLASEVFERALAAARLEHGQVSPIVATGYGRNAVRFATPPSPKSPVTPEESVISSLTHG